MCYRAIQRAQQFQGGRGLSRQVPIALQEVIQMKAARDGNMAVTWPGPWWYPQKSHDFFSSALFLLADLP